MTTKNFKRLFTLGSLLLLLSISFHVSGTVVTYPLQSCFTAGGVRTVIVNQSGTDYTIPVRKFISHGTTFYDYAHFSFSGTITIKVRNESGNISSYKISPNSYNMSGTVSGQDLSFTLTESRYIRVIINNDTARPLFILADPLETDVPASSGTGIYNITSSPYNADNTGTTNVTSIIQAAIDDANSAGGGIVYVPTGIFKMSKLNLKSNVDIYLQGGAVLKELTKSEGAFDTRMLESDNVSNVKVYGRGTIWCNGAAANNNVKTDQSGGQIRIGGFRITNNTVNIEIDGIIVSESTIWTVGFYNGTNEITVRNTKVLNFTDWAWNDGFNVCGGHHADISHCFYIGSDDASCCKMYENYPVHDVHFHDMVTYSDCASGFKAGNQAYDDLSNVTAENYRIIRCERGFNFDHWYGSGDWGGNITVKDFWIDEVGGTVANSLNAYGYQDCPFRFITVDYDGSGVGPVHDILIENINYPTGPNDSYLLGYNAGNNISNIEFRNCKYNGNPVSSATAGDIQVLNYVNNIIFTDTDLATPENRTNHSGFTNISSVDDNDVSTAALDTDGTGWIEYDFGEEKTLNIIRIYEDNGGSQVDQYKLDSWNGTSWVNVFDWKNSSIFGWDEQAINVTTQKVRLYVRDNDSGVSIHEVEIFDAGQQYDIIDSDTYNSRSSNWQLGDGVYDGDLTLGSGTQTTNSDDAWMDFYLGENKQIKWARIREDNGGLYQVYQWKVQYYDGSWHDAFPWTNSTIAGWNEIDFPDKIGSRIRVWCRPEPGKYVQLDEFECYVADFTQLKGLKVTGSIEISANENILEAYPNPSKGIVTFHYQLSNNAPVSLKIFNVNGKLIKTLLNEESQQGNKDNRIVWNSSDESGNFLKNGIYFVQMKVGNKFTSHKFILAR